MQGTVAEAASADAGHIEHGIDDAELMQAGFESSRSGAFVPQIAGVKARARHGDTAAPEAGDAAHERIHHPLHERTGHGGVDRVAARLQDIRAGLGSFRLRRHHHRALTVSHAASLEMEWPRVAETCVAVLTRPGERAMLRPDVPRKMSREILFEPLGRCP